MCITHLIHYRQCSHNIPDVQANINDRCDAVSAALVFYHDQPSWEPLNEPLIVPRTCPPVKLRGRLVSQFVLQEQAAWDLWMIGQFESNGFGETQRRELMNRALGSIATPPRNIWALYPANQERQYYALIDYQNRPNKAPNVVFTTVDGGCGRGTRPACHGQGAPAAPAAPPHPSPPIPPAGPVPSADQVDPPVCKPSSSLPESDNSTIAGDDVRRTRSATGLERMPDRTAANAAPSADTFANQPSSGEEAEDAGLRETAGTEGHEI